MKTITFYSYKGGVGRTLAAANFAVYLAKLGMKTVIIDFDLEAPGIDAKFPLLKVPENQKGVLDYILYYQQTNNDPGDVAPLALQVPVDSSNNNVPLWLIPGGQYLSEEYYKKLSQLDWNLIFSEKRDGVAFFQQFMARLEKELQPDFVIIDSRTGITEIAGLCTQQLADEVVMLSSMSRESIKVTKHIKRLIEQSKLAEALEKSIDVKVVVSRVPKQENLEVFKARCCKIFEIDETKLFFLFSCPALEQEEFIAISAPEKDEELVNNYVHLFYGLNIELAEKNILAEIERTSKNILLVPPEESEKQILELVALYPHPEAYRTAMRFFRLLKNRKETINFALKLFELIPSDEEVQRVLARYYLAQKNWLLNPDDINIQNVIGAIEPLCQRNELSPEEIITYASLLLCVEDYNKSLQLVLPYCEDEQLDTYLPFHDTLIAFQTAFYSAVNLNQSELANKLALSALERFQEVESSEGALHFAKQLLGCHASLLLLEKAVFLARKVGKVDQLEEELKSYESVIKSVSLQEYKSLQTLKSLGLHKLAAELDF